MQLCSTLTVAPRVLATVTLEVAVVLVIKAGVVAADAPEVEAVIAAVGATADKLEDRFSIVSASKTSYCSLLLICPILVSMY